jgi:hypothetical protein
MQAAALPSALGRLRTSSLAGHADAPTHVGRSPCCKSRVTFRRSSGCCGHRENQDRETDNALIMSSRRPERAQCKANRGARHTPPPRHAKSASATLSATTSRPLAGTIRRRRSTADSRQVAADQDRAACFPSATVCRSAFAAEAVRARRDPAGRLSSLCQPGRATGTSSRSAGRCALRSPSARAHARPMPLGAIHAHRRSCAEREHADERCPRCVLQMVVARHPRADHPVLPRRTPRAVRRGAPDDHPNAT